MATRIAAALLFGIPALYRIWYYRDAIGTFAFPILGISLVMLAIAGGLLLRKQWGYQAARVALWVVIGLAVAGFILVPVSGTDQKGIFETLFLPRAMGVSLLAILFSVWLLVVLNRQDVKKDFGIA